MASVTHGSREERRRRRGSAPATTILESVHANLAGITPRLETLIAQCHEIQMQQAQLREDTDQLTIRIERLEQHNMARLIPPGMSVSQIASEADQLATQAIFPECHQKPFCLSSLCDLMAFLDNLAEADDVAGPCAEQEAFNQLSDDDKVAIRARAVELFATWPYLRVSITTLKDTVWRQAHGSTTVEETTKVYHAAGDNAVLDAIRECVGFIARKRAQSWY